MVLAPDSSAHFDSPSIPHPAPFSQRPWVQNVLPFLTSLALHASLVVFGIATYQVVKTFKPNERPQVTIPTLAALPDDHHSTILDQPREMTSQMNLPVVPDAEQTDIKSRGSLAGVLNPGGGNNTDGVADPVIGLSPHPAGGKGFGPFAGPGDGSGTPFGDPNAPSFIGVKFPPSGAGNAKRVVFVCDASGSMISTFDTLRAELRKVTNPLSPRYSYNIIFFSGETRTPKALDTTLVPATPEVKRRTAEFLDRISPIAETNPLPALELAFKQNPDLIFLLTDGDFPDNQAVTDTIIKLNPTRRVKVNTILFVPNKAAVEENKSFADVLKRIASDNGGLFKAATADALP